MSKKTNYQSEKMTEAERKKKISVETENPVPSVPNRAHTEMSTHTHTQASRLNIDEGALHSYAERYKHKRMHDSAHREETE